MDIQTTNERIGVGMVTTICARYGWILRECYVKDFGIDAIIESYDSNSRESKNMIALQIKSGDSYFEEKSDGCYVFRFDEGHKCYWESFLMPVIIVLYNDSSKRAIYEVFNDKNIIKTGKGYKINIHENNDFEVFLKNEAINIKKMPEYIYNYNYLMSHLELMEAVQNGYDVIVRAHEWVNKSSGRGHVAVWIYDDTKVVDILDWNYYYPTQLYELVISKLFPWADFITDEEFLECEDIESLSPCNLNVLQERNICDSYTGGRALAIKAALRAGEVALYELHLKLNDLGKSFLTTHKTLSSIKVYKGLEIERREKLESNVDLFEDAFLQKHPFLE